MRILIINFFFILSTLCFEIPQTGKNSIEYRKVKFKIWITLADEYKKLSKDSPQIKEKAQKLLQDFASQKTLLNPFSEFTELAVDAKELLSLKPQDPLILTIIARCIFLGGNDKLSDYNLSVKLLEQAYKDNLNAQYSSFAKMLTAKFLSDTIVRSQSISGKEENRIKGYYMKAFTEYLFSHTPEKELRFKAEFAKGYFKYRPNARSIEPLYKMVQDNKQKMDSWLVEMISGMYNEAKVKLTHANGKYDDKFNDDHHHFQVSSALHYSLAHEIRPNWPEAATAMISKAEFLDEGKSSKEWFLEAVKAEFDHIDAYYKYIFSIDDNINKMIEFGKFCKATNRYDTEVPSMQPICVMGILRVLGNNFEELKKYKVYDDLHETYKVYEQQEVKDGIYFTGFKNYYRAVHFCFAYNIGRYTHVRKLYQMFGESLYRKNVARKYGIRFKSDISFAFAISGPASKLVHKLNQQLNWNKKKDLSKWRSEKELDELIELLEDAKSMTSEKESEHYFEHLSKITQLEKKFNTGEWVNLTFNKGLPAWKVYDGNWDIIDENTILANNLDNQKQYLSSEAFFEPPYKIELEVESIKSNWRGRHLQAGLILGRMYGKKTGRTFWVDGLRNRAGIGFPDEDPEGYDLDSRSKKNKMTVYVWPGHHELYVNKGIQASIRPDPEFEPLKVSIGIMPWYPISGIVKYSNIKIKKINFNKPPPIDKTEERISYFKKRIKHDNTSYVYASLAVDYNNVNKYDEALDILKAADKLYPSWWNLYISSIVVRNNGEPEKAAAYFEEALKRKIAEKYARLMVMKSYSWFLATYKDEKIRNPEKALKIALDLNKIKVRKEFKAEYLSTLSAAYSVNGEFDKAIEIAAKALQFPGSTAFRESLKKRITLYKEKKIYISEE